MEKKPHTLLELYLHLHQSSSRTTIFFFRVKKEEVILVQAQEVGEGGKK